jgi:hypothetical protein
MITRALVIGTIVIGALALLARIWGLAVYSQARSVDADAGNV